MDEQLLFEGNELQKPVVSSRPPNIAAWLTGGDDAVKQEQNQEQKRKQEQKEEQKQEKPSIWSTGGVDEASDRGQQGSGGSTDVAAPVVEVRNAETETKMHKGKPVWG